MEKESLVTFIWHLKTLGQKFYIQAVVLPELYAVIDKHMPSIEELGEIKGIGDYEV